MNVTTDPPRSDSCGYYIEVAEHGPWLRQDLSVTPNWTERGVWPTMQAAEDAMEESLRKVPELKP